MRWLRAAIARLLGIPTEQVLSPSTAQQTQTAGPANPEHITPHGNKPSAQPTVPRPVKPAVKAKSVRVRRVTTAQSQVQEQVPAQTLTVRQSGVGGRKQATPASQPVSPSPKRKRSPAQPTTQEASSKPARKPAQTTNGQAGKQAATPVRRTRQHAK